MIPTENVEVKPDGQLVLQRNTKDLVVQGDAVFTGDIDAQNGVLQIDQIELPAGATQSVKKIYCHPVYIYYGSAGYKLDLTFLIFNNSSTAFTLATFKTFIDDLTTQLTNDSHILASGYYSNGTDICDSVSFMYKGIVSGNYGIVGWNAQTRTRVVIAKSTFSDIFPSDVYFEDSVNAIN